MSVFDRERTVQLQHAMQTGVAMDMQRGSKDTEPKHLRVGVNSALVEASVLARLLIDHGIVTMDEYEKALADEMEREVQRYRDRLNLPDNVELA